jgi:putative Mg2+ transporter-C (MgtC) family protein
MIWEELIAGFSDTREIVRVIIRLLAAMLLGAVVGVQREHTGKPAGLRTHILVAMGGALFILAPLEFGMNADGLSRVIQGLVAGIGFLGAGAILKLSEERQIAGLTTAAGIWMTAAVGVAVGLGRLGIGLIGTILTLITLSLVASWENRISKKQLRKDEEPEKQDNEK